MRALVNRDARSETHATAAIRTPAGTEAIGAVERRVSIFSRHKSDLVAADQALPGRSERPFHLAEKHLVLGTPLVTDEAPEGYEVALFGLGCFWGAEEVYWQVPGVWPTSAGETWSGWSPSPAPSSMP